MPQVKIVLVLVAVVFALNWAIGFLTEKGSLEESLTKADGLREEFRLAKGATVSGEDGALERLLDVVRRVEEEYPGSPTAERLVAEGGEVLVKAGVDGGDGRYLALAREYFQRAIEMNAGQEKPSSEREVRYWMAIAGSWRESGKLLRPEGEWEQAYAAALHAYGEARALAGGEFGIQLDRQIKLVEAERDAATSSSGQ